MLPPIVQAPVGLSPVAFDEHFRASAGLLAGVDEAGRGPLAGPVVAAAVILDPKADYPGVDDSKKLKPKDREKAFDLILSRAVAASWAAVEAEEVDRLNPLRAALLAMSRAVAGLDPAPALVLVDGNFAPDAAVPALAVIKGDGRSLCIGAASILAKVIRDRIMLEWHARHPQYGFNRHKGYGTAEHLAALRRYGPSPCHRLSFKGVKGENRLFLD
jgi:ribonuclease HII